jgi:thioredoxin 1
MWIPAQDGERLKTMTADSAPHAYFFHTRLCGTCKVARRMLEVVMHTVPGIDMIDCPAEQCRELVQEWKVESVPCLLIAKANTVIARTYAFGTVQDLYQFLSSHLIAQRDSRGSTI